MGVVLAGQYFLSSFCPSFFPQPASVLVNAVNPIGKPKYYQQS